MQQPYIPTHISESLKGEGVFHGCLINVDTQFLAYALQFSFLLLEIKVAFNLFQKAGIQAPVSKLVIEAFDSVAQVSIFDPNFCFDTLLKIPFGFPSHPSII
jgi:hypothetical protein